MEGQLKNCLICGALGEDFFMRFFCSNALCSNYEPINGIEKKDVEKLLFSMWNIYNIGENYERFFKRFVDNGGRIEVNNTMKSYKDAIIIEPNWLRKRICG
jgi:hypothetical protein